MSRCIVLVGMPGSGKSSVGKALASLKNLDFFDTDTVIEQDEKTSIPEIFKNNGEEYFRQAETNALKKTLINAPCVIASGGGIVLKEQNRDLLKDHTVVFLKRDISSLPKDGRPLSLKNDLEEMYKKRLPLYESCADIIVDNIGIEKTAKEKKDLL